MRKGGQEVRVQVGEATKETAVVVTVEVRAGGLAMPAPEPRRRSRRLSALLVAGTLIRAFSVSAALALKPWPQRIRWAEVLDWLTS